MPTLYLASRSPRRRQLLERIGIDFSVVDVEVNEDWSGSEEATVFVTRLAREKAHAGAAAIAASAPVLASDTEVVIDGRVLGKPRDRNDAVAMLLDLSGREHLVHSAVALVRGSSEDAALCTSRVTFRKLGRNECERYCDSGEPFGKAGAYAIQGRAAAFVSRLDGSYSGVVGLPLKTTAELLARNGIAKD